MHPRISSSPRCAGVNLKVATPVQEKMLLDEEHFFLLGSVR